MAIIYRMPWWEIEDPIHREGLQRQYDREIGAGHPLCDARGRVVGKRDDNDDILVALADGRHAIVHLTWSGNRGGAIWPMAVIYETVESVNEEIVRHADAG